MKRALARFAARLVLRAWPDAVRGDPALREREETFRRLASAANEGITIVIDGRIVEANNAFGRLFGYEVSEILGRTPLDFIAPESRAQAERLIATASDKPYETRGQRKGGTLFDVEVIIKSIPYKGRTALGCVVRDISERKEIDRLKNEFVSIVSHELRTPLTSIRGSLGLMEGGAVGELPPKARELARIARQNADRLIRLINDILDLEKIEAGKAQLTIAALDPVDVVESTIAELRAMAMQYGVTLTSHVERREPIAGDRDRVVQVLTNLLSNAVKFSPQGSTVHVAVGDGRTGFLRLAVRDAGPGIPGDQQARLFQRFEQLESANTRRRGGTGLGLAISRSLVEQHGGRIGVESTPGQGSTFWFELPLLPAARGSGETELGSDRAALLVIEDDPAVARVLDIILRREGHRVVLVGTLADARQVLGESAVPAAILLDMGLPDGSGLEMLDHLAGAERLSRVPVVVLSGDGPTGDERNARIFEWITKPFAKEELVRAVRAAMAAVLAFVLLASLSGGAAGAQRPSAEAACASDAVELQHGTDDGWRELRAQRLREAEIAFRGVLARCGSHVGALVGAGYAALRRNEITAAARYFERAVAAHPRNYDALTGLGMVAWRRADHAASRRWFEQAVAIVPGDSLSTWYLSRLPAVLDSAALPARPRPVQTVVAARVGRRILEVPEAEDGWSALWVKALNIGVALPGRHPSEFPPDDGTYEEWIALAAEMNVNTLRVYTIHPPHFYRALAQWNETHPERPLWLIHGVWTELPPGRKEERYDDRPWNARFLDEMRRVVDVVHGRALIPHRRGHASGLYVDDVSRWTLAWIIGREWEPYSVEAFARRHPRRTSYRGRYISVEGGNAVDAWLAEVSDAMVAYEMERYNAQRPLAYTNWPTLDPLEHPTESTLAQEDSIRRVRREVVPEPPKEYDNDAIGLDATLVRASAEYPAGVFASFHAYPYYPDFMAYDTGYARARAPEGPSNYYGYLRRLVEHFGDMPVIISEYGVPSSRGTAHVQPQGWHHGGHSEERQAEINARLTRDIHAAGAAGGGLFALMDEWFKKNWLVIDFEHPAERNRLWLNALDAEQHYGVIAMRAGHRDSAIVIDGARDDWRGRGEWYQGSEVARPAALQLRSFSVAHDEAYVYLRLETGAIDWARARYLVGIDTHGRTPGDALLPYTRTRVPTGLEFVLDLRGPEGSRLLVDEPYNLYRNPPIRGSNPPATQQVYNRPFRSAANANARYDSLIVVTNRRRIGRDGTVYPAISHDRNLLLHARQQETSLADWFADTLSGIIEVRIPWGMLHVLDPSSQLVLRGDAKTGEIAGVPTDGFRFVVQSFDPRDPSGPGDRLPRGPTPDAFGELPLWAWPTWDEPRWWAERKPQFDVMRRVFGEIPSGGRRPSR